jgi:uncharacterized membrane protein
VAQEDRHPRLSNWSGYALGFSLGGFFDGILLHQVLQWHHLLSGLEAARQDVRVLILADGVFHLVMYLVAAWGLWLLWRGRHDFAAPGADRRLFAAGLLGFGAWHVVDAIISHWLLGIHRIRMDADNPLLWDLLWLAAFGIVPLVLGLALRSSERTRPSLLSAPLALVLAIAVSAPLAALPPPGSDIVMVLFHPGAEPAHALAAIRATGSELIWTDPSQQLWAVRAGEGSDRNALYGYGALLVSNSILPAGCLDWTRA